MIKIIAFKCDVHVFVIIQKHNKYVTLFSVAFPKLIKLLIHIMLLLSSKPHPAIWFEEFSESIINERKISQKVPIAVA